MWTGTLTGLPSLDAFQAKRVTLSAYDCWFLHHQKTDGTDAARTDRFISKELSIEAHCCFSYYIRHSLRPKLVRLLLQQCCEHRWMTTKALISSHICSLLSLHARLKPHSGTVPYSYKDKDTGASWTYRHYQNLEATVCPQLIVRSRRECA